MPSAAVAAASFAARKPQWFALPSPCVGRLRYRAIGLILAVLMRTSFGEAASASRVPTSLRRLFTRIPKITNNRFFRAIAG